MSVLILAELLWSLSEIEVIVLRRIPFGGGSFLPEYSASEVLSDFQSWNLIWQVKKQNRVKETDVKN